MLFVLVVICSLDLIYSRDSYILIQVFMTRCIEKKKKKNSEKKNLKYITKTIHTCKTQTKKKTTKKQKRLTVINKLHTTK